MSLSRKFAAITAVMMCMTPLAQLSVASESPSFSQVSGIELENLRQPAVNRFSSGQPTQADLEALAAAGVKHIVSLRPASELEWDERAVVEGLGMTFHRVPVTVPEGISYDNASTLSQLLLDIGDEAALLHCSTGNRVGAMMALQHEKVTGDSETAVAIGKAWGITMPPVENRVRDLMQD